MTAILKAAVQKTTEFVRRIGSSLHTARPRQPFPVTFESKYGPEHPDFLQFGFFESVLRAKQQLRLLLVFLDCDLHADAPRVAAQLTSPDVMAVIQEQYLCWAADVRSPEGYAVAAQIQAFAYPVFAVITDTPNGARVIAMRGGVDATHGVAEWLRDTAATAGAALSSLRAHRQSIERDRQLRAEQDAAVEESLRRDREREQARLEEERRAAEEEQRLRQAQREQEEALASLPAEPSPDTPGTVSVVLRLPSGQRIARRFQPTDTLATVQLLATAHGCPPRTHALCTHFPRRNFTAADAPCSLAELGLSPQAALFVVEMSS